MSEIPNDPIVSHYQYLQTAELLDARDHGKCRLVTEGCGFSRTQTYVLHHLLAGAVCADCGGAPAAGAGPA